MRWSAMERVGRPTWGLLVGGLSVLLAGAATFVYLNWMIEPDVGQEALVFLPILGLLVGSSAGWASYADSVDEAAGTAATVLCGALGGTMALSLAVGAATGDLGPAVLAVGFVAAYFLAPAWIVGCTLGLVVSWLVRRARRRGR